MTHQKCSHGINLVSNQLAISPKHNYDLHPLRPTCPPTSSRTKSHHPNPIFPVTAEEWSQQSSPQDYCHYPSLPQVPCPLFPLPTNMNPLNTTEFNPHTNAPNGAEILQQIRGQLYTYPNATQHFQPSPDLSKPPPHTVLPASVPWTPRVYQPSSPSAGPTTLSLPSTDLILPSQPGIHVDYTFPPGPCNWASSQSQFNQPMYDLTRSSHHNSSRITNSQSSQLHQYAIPSPWFFPSASDQQFLR